jgi:hypothetical protein
MFAGCCAWAMEQSTKSKVKSVKMMDFLVTDSTIRVSEFHGITWRLLFVITAKPAIQFFLYFLDSGSPRFGGLAEMTERIGWHISEISHY